MIDKIELTNYESHPHSELAFSPGVNVITGSSDNGKSAVIRALLWVLRNPQGDAMVSNFIRKNGKQVGVTAVTIKANGHSITREKSRVKNGKSWEEYNGYRADFGEYTACRANVPEEVAKALNLDDCNVSTQFSPHFLLDNTGGEVSKYLNATVGLDAQDGVLLELDRLHRARNREIEQLSEKLESLKKGMASLKWTSKAKKLLKTVNANTDHLNDLSCKFNEINDLVLQYEKIVVYDDNRLMEIKTLCEKVENNSKVLNEINVRFSTLQGLISEFPTVRPLPDFAPITNAVQNLNKSLQLKDNALGGIVTQLQEYNASESVYKEQNARLIVLREKFERLAKESKQICPHSGKFCKYWSEQ